MATSRTRPGSPQNHPHSSTFSLRTKFVSPLLPPFFRVLSGIGGKPLVYIQTIFGSLNTTYPVRFISETNQLREAIRPMHSSEHMGINNARSGQREHHMCTKARQFCRRSACPCSSRYDYGNWVFAKTLQVARILERTVGSGRAAWESDHARHGLVRILSSLY
jgi:hypothetical protein